MLYFNICVGKNGADDDTFFSFFVDTNQVKLAYQESEIVALLKKIPLVTNEMNTIRGRAEELREGTLCDYRPVLPLMLASFIFDVLCTPGTVCIGLNVQREPSEIPGLERVSKRNCLHDKTT